MPVHKLKHVKLLLLDVDGVLTDGSIIYTDQGAEIKAFNVKDGLGMQLLMEVGIKVGIVTGRTSNALYHRCNNLGITLIYDKVQDKAALLEVISQQTGVPWKEIAFVGDDLPDLPLMRKVGLSVAVADAHETIREHADMVTASKGGAGAAREICEKILKAQGHWENIMKKRFKV